MENLIFSRIDDRLIHGQVCTAWLKSLPTVKHVLVVDDKTAKDPFMGEMFALLIPEHISIEVRTIEEAIKIMKDGLPKPTMMIVKVPDTIKQLVDSGIDIDFLNIGGMGMTAGRKKLFQNISASDAERDIFRELIAKGVKIEVQIIPAAKQTDISKLL
ncbi:MAG: PTS sugar transporter subunit IIB [Lachnospiraceae bacterium]|jgi:mannose/fructose/N-acetylgalactosamine-specific phosphotransferase system component IIB|nr:PTS sugar transporter subunit IIB [Lachnospiraceae bacterium]